jgi:hypothetical protein
MMTSKTHPDDLDNVARRLHLQWEAATERWRDRVQQDYAERYYIPLQQEHRLITRHAAALIEVLQKAQQTVR